MSAKPELTPREYERLSAYLDGELPDSEQQALEADLQAQPMLQEELDSLRQTVMLIQQLPPMPVPRNFTLTAEMVVQSAQERIVQMPRRRSIINVWSVAAAMIVIVVGAALLLVLAGSPNANLSPASGGAANNQVAALPTQMPATEIQTSKTDSFSDDRLRTESTQPQALDETDSDNAELSDADLQPAENAPPAPAAIADTGRDSDGIVAGDAPVDEEPALQFATTGLGEENATAIGDMIPEQPQPDTFAAGIAEPQTGGGFSDDEAQTTPEGIILEVVAPTEMPDTSTASQEEAAENEDRQATEVIALSPTLEANTLLQIEETATALSSILLETPTTTSGRSDGERRQSADDSSGLLVIGAGLIVVLLIAGFTIMRQRSS